MISTTPRRGCTLRTVISTPARSVAVGKSFAASKVANVVVSWAREAARIGMNTNTTWTPLPEGLKGFGLNHKENTLIEPKHRKMIEIPWKTYKAAAERAKSDGISLNAWVIRAIKKHLMR